MATEEQGIKNLWQSLKTSWRIERGEIVTVREAYLEFRKAGLVAEDALSQAKRDLADRRNRLH